MDIDHEAIAFYSGKVNEAASMANKKNYKDSAGQFVNSQFDETVVSKRKYQRGKRSRSAAEYIMTGVEVSPSKRARKLFGPYIPDKTAKSLQPMIEHLAAPNRVVTTDGHRSYDAIGKDVRIIKSIMLLITMRSLLIFNGIHTNHVEAMHMPLLKGR